MDIPAESSNHRPGEPLRDWSSTQPVTATDAELIIKAAKAQSAIRKLVAGDELTTEDEISLGRLNSWCVQMWYEPMVMLIDQPQIHPALPRLLRDRTKVLRETL